MQMTRFGHCRTSGKCARLRTIERSQAQRAGPSKIFLRLSGRFMSGIAHLPQIEDTYGP
jgi:hypothetical protein